MRDVAVTGEAIRLGQLLKLAGVCGSGGEATDLLASGSVLVDGDIETRRGRQVHRGSVVDAAGERLRVV